MKDLNPLVEKFLHASSKGHSEEALRVIRDENFPLTEDCWGHLALNCALDNHQGDLVRLLLERGADPSALGTNRGPLLHRAAAAGAVDVLEAIVQFGASVSALDGQDNAPIHHAAHEGRVKVIQELIRLGSPVDEPNYFGCTPLAMAAHQGHTASVRVLLSAGARVNGNEPGVPTPLFWAALFGYREIEAILREHNAEKQLTCKPCATPASLTWMDADQCADFAFLCRHLYWPQETMRVGAVPVKAVQVG